MPADVTLKIDDALLRHLGGGNTGGAVPSRIEQILRAHLDAERRWAEEHGIMVEALAAGAAERA